MNNVQSGWKLLITDMEGPGSDRIVKIFKPLRTHLIKKKRRKLNREALYSRDTYLRFIQTLFLTKFLSTESIVVHLHFLFLNITCLSTHSLDFSLAKHACSNPSNFPPGQISSNYYPGNDIL